MIVEYLPELIGGAGLVLVRWFAGRVISQLDKIHIDLKSYGERIVKLETKLET